MNQIVHPGVVEAMAQLKELSADEETRQRAERRELALIAERTELEAAMQGGIEIGIEKGIEKGIEQGMEKGMIIGEENGMTKALNRLIANGIPEAQARAMLGM